MAGNGKIYSSLNSENKNMTSVNQTLRAFTIAIRPSSTNLDGSLDASAIFIHTISAKIQLWMEYWSEPKRDYSAPAPEGLEIFGDGQDYDAASQQPFLGNGVVIRWSKLKGEVEILSSITGLPAVFLYESPELTVAASSIQRIAEVPGVRLQFDPQGVAEHATIGHPVKHRTLFRGVSLVPAGSLLTLINGPKLAVTARWTPMAAEPYQDWSDYLDAQVVAMQAAVQRLDTRASCLSLTAGLDTRAIYSLLIQAGVRIPAFTMTGKRLSLDALRARQLCKAYDYPHQCIAIDTDYLNNLPALTVEASRLSGGLAGLSQAFEVYFYRSLPNTLRARISGNLGNQIGRSGTEGSGVRGVSLDILSDGIREGIGGQSHDHWLVEGISKKGGFDPLFLIQNENLHASLGNSCVGSHFVVQQSPYADCTMIENKLREPQMPAPQVEEIWRIKWRDLRHRLLGQPVSRSFQRRIVRDIGGFVAQCPINWGWRARGGVSFGGLILGATAVADAVFGSRFRGRPFPTRLLSLSGIHGFSGFQADDVLAQPKTLEFLNDTLRSTHIRQGGALSLSALDRALQMSVTNPDSRAQLEFSLEIALAQQNFGVS